MTTLPSLSQGSNESWNRTTIAATDGVEIQGRIYHPSETPWLSVVMLPGIGIPQRVFRHLGHWLAACGVRSISIDYRGIADSKHAHGPSTLTAWATQDAVGALRYTEQNYPQPVALIGHSFGGQALGFSPEFRRLAASILIGAQFGQPRYFDGAWRPLLSVYWHLLLPIGAQLFARVPGLGGEALPRDAAREWARWGRNDRWLLSFVEHAEANYAAFDRPVLSCSSFDDRMAPRRAIDALLAQLHSARIERVVASPEELNVPRIGHIGLLYPQAKPVWQNMLDFLRRHTTGSEPHFKSDLESVNHNS